MKHNGCRSRRLVLAAMLMTACGNDQPRGPESERLIAIDVVLTVVNRTNRSADVLIESDTLQHHLGEVAKGGTQSFSVPISLVNSGVAVSLAATLGPSTVRSESFRLHRGESVVWTITGPGAGTIVKN